MKKRVVFILLFFAFICFLGIVSADNSASNVPNAAGNLLTSQISVPESLQIPARILFGLGGAEINLQEFVVLVVLWVIILLILRDVLSLALGSNWKSLAGAIIITCLISASGALSQMTYYLVDLAFAKSAVYLLIVFFVLIILAYVALRFLKIIKKKSDILKNEKEGMELALRERGRRRSLDSSGL